MEVIGIGDKIGYCQGAFGNKGIGGLGDNFPAYIKQFSTLIEVS